MASPQESDPTSELGSSAGLGSTAELELIADPDQGSARARSGGLGQSPGFDRLLELFQDVTRARAALTVARRAPLGRSRLVDAPRLALLLALEAYTAELQARNLPVPYGIRDDLRIQRRILGRVADTSG